MLQLWYYALILVVVAFAAAGSILLLRAYVMGSSAGSLFFKARSDPRLAVVEQAMVDGKRRLILIRRDNVEHLIMTGGPVDVVIESAIAPQPAIAPPSHGAAIISSAPAIEQSSTPLRRVRIFGI